MRRAVLVAVSVAVALALALTGQTRVLATQQQICGNGGSGYCMNDWNGAYQYVKMYNGGASHEDFGVIFEVSACGSGKRGRDGRFAAVPSLSVSWQTASHL